MIRLCRELGVPVTVIGNGSNLLVSDEGIRGVVIRLCRCMEKVETVRMDDELVLKAGAGALLTAVAKRTFELGYTGMEFAAGIPGTLGGAVYMNAGAYDGEMKNVILSAEVMDDDLEIFELSNAELELSYRHSAVMDKGWLVLSALLGTKKGDKKAILEKAEDFQQRRHDKQPLEYPSAGSTFKRPEGYFAGKLIQDAGLKGFTVGGAQVSEKHAGFVINTGNATAGDIKQLIEEVRERVYVSSGIMLEPEVRFLGF